MANHTGKANKLHSLYWIKYFYASFRSIWMVDKNVLCTLGDGEGGPVKHKLQ